VIRLLLLGLLMGAPWALAFAPWSLWWLGLTQLLMLPLLGAETRSVKQAAILGVGFGWSAYGLGVSWLYISMQHYGGLPGWLAVLAVLAFGLYLSIFPALALVVYRRWMMGAPSERPMVHAVLWAASWTFFEWLRGTFLTGFAWLSLGDALVDSPCRALLPWLGSYGTLFALLLVGHALLLSALSVWKSRRFVKVRKTSLVLGSMVVFLLGLALWPVHTQSSGTLQVAAVQTNVDQSVKFDPDQVVSNMDKVFQLGETASGLLHDQHNAVLLLPETVSPLVWSDSPLVWRQRFRDLAQPQHFPLIMGSAIEDRGQYFNSIIRLDGSEEGAGLNVPSVRHDKRHLVPFGEYIPFGFSWFVSMLNMPMGEFMQGGAEQQPLQVAQQFLAATVCYEDIFGGEFASLLKQAKQEPTLLLNLSNLAWFGQSWALDQHAQMGRTRSAEHRKPGLRVTNTGLSGVVDEFGQWQQRVEPAKGLVWVTQVEGRRGLTFFAKCGDLLWFLMWLAALVMICVRHRQQKAYNTGSLNAEKSRHVD
jgi:apolipoprotein N-acyltransferase